ncbi:MAG TPA: agglutinin biogenesis protein MshI [Paucimonas sp.]|nr:agglutinin biogenesis protein MshI [Paucimonas sp.]
MPAVESVVFSPGNELASQLEKLAKDVRAAAYHCTTLLGVGEYQLLSVDAPNVPPEELKVAIRWRLKDLLDFHVDDATIDVLDVPVDKHAPVRNRSMFAVAARNQVIEQRQTLFADAKFPLSVIDIPEMAQRNISALLEPEGRGVAMLSFDAAGGLLTVTYSGELYLSRRIEVPLSQLQEGGEEQRTPYYDRITLELQRSLDHFDRQYHFITMSKLFLAPLPDGSEALQKYLASNLYMPVEMLDLETVLDFSKTPELKSRDGQHRFFMTLGAALRHEEKVL